MDNMLEAILTWILTEDINAPVEIKRKALLLWTEALQNTKKIGELRFPVRVALELQELYEQGRKKIQMIKMVREQTGLALKEAKDFVERNWDFPVR